MLALRAGLLFVLYMIKRSATVHYKKFKFGRLQVVHSILSQGLKATCISDELRKTLSCKDHE